MYRKEAVKKAMIFIISFALFFILFRISVR